jgi:hypothetical protein
MKQPNRKQRNLYISESTLDKIKHFDLNNAKCLRDIIEGYLEKITALNNFGIDKDQFDVIFHMGLNKYLEQMKK